MCVICIAFQQEIFTGFRKEPLDIVNDSAKEVERERESNALDIIVEICDRRALEMNKHFDDIDNQAFEEVVHCLEDC